MRFDVWSEYATDESMANDFPGAVKEGGSWYINLETAEEIAELAKIHTFGIVIEPAQFWTKMVIHSYDKYPNG